MGYTRTSDADRVQPAVRAPPGAMNSRQHYRRLLGHVKPYRRVFVLGVVCMALFALSQPLLPALLQPLVDGSFLNEADSGKLLLPGLIVGLFMVRGLCSYGSQVALGWVSQHVVKDLRVRMFRRLLALPSAFYDRASAGSLLSKLSYDVAQVAQASTHALTDLVKDGLTVVGLVAYMVWLDWRLAFTVLVVAPPIVLSVLRVSRRLRNRSRDLQASMADITHVAEEAINGQQVVKVYGGEGFEGRRFDQAAGDARKHQMKVLSISAANVPLVQLLLSIGIAAMVYVAITLAGMNQLTTGEFVSFFAAMAILLAPIKRLTGINQVIQRGLAAAESIFTFLEEPGEVDNGRQALGRARGELRFEQVGFAFGPGLPEVLSGVSLCVAAGSTVALVGASGAGKSTLASLVPRFYAPTAGRILLDGIDLQDITLRSLRDNIALVSQQVVLFDDTVRNNIAYGVSRALAEEELLRAAEAAHAMEFIRQLPQGLETSIGENGVRLSGGQRQRLAIARALLKDAPLLIFDEATSALDTASERHIQAAMDTLRRGRTCLVIAHRLSTIESADSIVVLDHGRVVEQGAHAELLAHGGAYAGLYRAQFGGVRVATA